jgi:hypothetical protein
MEYETVPLPEPVLPEVIEMNESLEAADHEQPIDVVTLTVPEPLVLENDLLVGLTL